MDKQEIDRAISSAFDSVILINKLQSGEDKLNRILPKEKIDKMIQDNILHLQTMMNFDWFKGALSPSQSKQIEKITK